MSAADFLKKMAGKKVPKGTDGKAIPCPYACSLTHPASTIALHKCAQVDGHAFEVAHVCSKHLGNGACHRRCEKCAAPCYRNVLSVTHGEGGHLCKHHAALSEGKPSPFGEQQAIAYDGFISVPDSWTPKQVEAFQKVAEKIKALALVKWQIDVPWEAASMLQVGDYVQLHQDVRMIAAIEERTELVWQGALKHFAHITLVAKPEAAPNSPVPKMNFTGFDKPALTNFDTVPEWKPLSLRQIISETKKPEREVAVAEPRNLRQRRIALD